MNTNRRHRCDRTKPICTRCELQHRSIDEMRLNHENLRKLFAAYGHNYDDPTDDWNLL